MERLEKRLAKTLRRLRGETTQRDFAKKLGIDHGSLNRIEQGKQNVTIKTLQKLCDRLKCDIDRLFEER
jgi:transcriptional regulator with XRE-family HTH domain